MMCYDIYVMLYALDCGVLLGFFVELLTRLYCDPIYGVTRMTRGVPLGSLARFKGVPTDHMHG